MDYSVTLARHFARLVWLLLNQPANIDEQKAALRAIITVSKEGAVTFRPHEHRLVANGQFLPEALSGVQELAAQFIGHAVRELVIDQGASPADVLGVARVLAVEPVPGDGGAAIEAKVRALGVKSVRITIEGQEVVQRRSGSITPVAVPVFRPGERPSATPAVPGPPTVAPAGPAAASARKPTPPAGASPVPPKDLEPPAIPRAPTITGVAATTPGKHGAAFEGALVDPKAIEEEKRLRAERESQERQRSTERAALPEDVVPEHIDRSVFLPFSAVRTQHGSAEQLFAQLDATHSVNATTRLLDEIVGYVENLTREGRSEQVAEAFYGVVRRESEGTDPELRRAYAMGVRRLAKPGTLRAVALMLPRQKDRLEQLRAVLHRAGEDGAEAVIEQLVAAQSLADRRIYFDSLVALKSGVSTLIHMLGDQRWYVARNAADLLGEMNATEAEVPLAELLKHEDERVRRAAIAALAKLGTPRSVESLHVALKDASPQVRMQAAAGLAMRRGMKASNTLVKALDGEGDGEVQLAILAGLGRLATPDAVAKLIKAAEPEGRLFKKKSIAYRVAAVHALGEARTPAAVAALQKLLDDREKEVKEAVFRVVMQAQQRPPENAKA